MYGLGYLALVVICLAAWFFHYRPLEMEAHMSKLAKIRTLDARKDADKDGRE